MGAYDDFKKIKFSNSSGISSKFKITSQIILAIIGVSFFVYLNDYQNLNNLYFPFFKNLIINLGWFFIPFAVIVIIPTAPKEPPRDKEPVSPIKILAGGALNHKKPKQEPIIDPQKIATSPVPSM